MSRKYCALIDNRLVEDTLFLRRRLGMPRMLTEEPIIDPGQVYGTVRRDKDGRWTMWYLGLVARDPVTEMTGVDRLLLLAHSDDGLQWELPDLGLTGDRSYAHFANIFIGGQQTDYTGRYLSGWGGNEGFSIIDREETPHPHARGRYTAMTTAFPADTIGGICLLHSDDGLHWTAYPENPVIIGSPDTQNTFLYDPATGKYVCYMRPTIYCGMSYHANRRMARCESEDLIHWTPPRIVLDTDERDADAFDLFEEPGMHGHARGRSMQYQGMSVFIANGCYLGLAWYYDARLGTFIIELVHSDDGIDWQREALREPFIASGRPQGLHAPLVITAADAPILVGDEHYLYISTKPHGHHEIALADITGNMADRNAMLESTSIYALGIKRDRWVGYEAQEIEGELLSTPQNREGGSPLYLNAKISEGGYIRVEVEDQWGRPVKDAHLDEIDLIEGPLDEVDHIVTFGPGPKTIMRFPPIGPVRFRFFLKHATLYGWSFSKP